MSHAVAIIEGLLALEQGVKSITVGYGQVGSLTQDIAAIQSLRELSTNISRTTALMITN
ncbi:Methylaspartate mutase E chain [Citrobacter koseri]|uniref:Methylaspartate mutase E chain n=1 Tax=Citrobacter koseri TaxID=545 RepID=A0A3S4II26_CITKO|nr:Methylaspartate mutase E chain [Citrobacter koseri]